VTAIEKAIGFVGGRVALLSATMAKDDKPSINLRGRRSEALLMFQELQKLRKAESAKRRKLTKKT
jgi:hypothetical protein